MALYTPTLSDMITAVRSNVSEPNEGYYLKSEIITWLNLGCIDFARRTRILTSSAQTGSVNGQYEYNFPADLLRVLKVFYNEEELTYIDYHEILTVAAYKDLTVKGTVEYWYMRGKSDSPRTLHLYKAPSSGGLPIDIWYVQRPDKMTNDSDTFPMPVEWADAVIEWATSRAHRKQRQLPDAGAAMEIYMDYVNEAMQTRAEFSLDRPMVAKTEEMFLSPNDSRLWRR